MEKSELEKIKEFKFGENPQQKAELCIGDGMADYEVLFDKDLSYDNIINLSEVAKILSEFFDVPAVAITKHGICCGVALGSNIEDAYNKAFDCDPLGAFYGTIGFSEPIDLSVAKLINSMGIKVVLAPGFSDSALAEFETNSAIKVVKLNTSFKQINSVCKKNIIQTAFGTLVEDCNNSELDKDLFKVVTKTKPTTEQIEDAIFAWKVAKHTRTYTSVIAKDFSTSSIAQCCTNLNLAVENSLRNACDKAKDAVLATDTFIESQDVIYAAIQSRIGLIIETGGGPKDKEIIDLADKYGLSLIMTGIRNHKY